MRTRFRILIAATLLLLSAAPADAQETGRAAGVVIDQTNAIALPGVPVEAVGTPHIAYTDLDGRYDLELPAGEHRIRISLAGYAEQLVDIEIVPGQVTEVQVSLTTNVFAEEVAVVAPTLEAQSSTAAAQMMLRMRAPGVQDNIGGSEMRSNNDSDAADAMSRVTGVSVVDSQSVFVRGLGERYSNTTLNGATLPTTEPDRRVVPLDLFPTGLIDSVQVSKTYTPDKPSQFAGGLVEIIPLKLPAETAYEFSLGGAHNSITTGKSGLGYAGGSRWNGFDGGTRALPAGFPDRKVIRGGRFTSDELGFLGRDLERLGESFSNVWDPVRQDQPMNQSYSGLFGGRFGKLGVVTTLRHSQSSQITNEERSFYKVGAGGVERFNGPYDFDETQFVSTVGGVGNLAYQFSPNHRLSVDNFYTHVGTDETRIFEGFNSDADNDIRNQRLFFIEEQIRSHHVGGDHLFPSASNSRLDWKIAFSRADRAEPDLREVLYEFDPAREAFVLADESQSGLRQFNDLVDDSVELSANWSTLTENWAGLPTQFKFGASYIDRTRDFLSRRLRFVPTSTRGLDLSRPAEELFTPSFIGPNFQLKEETRPTDQYDAAQETLSAYGMVDVPLAVRLRLVAGARVENFRQQVDTFDPFARAVFGTTDVIRADLDETDVFPAVNVVYSVRHNQNLRIGFSQTVNRPEFRELAPFEFTDVVGGRATVGNPELQQSLIQNIDVRWELFPGIRGGGGRGQLLLQELRQPHRAHRRADGPAPDLVHQRRLGPQRRLRDRGAQGARPVPVPRRQLHLRRLGGHPRRRRAAGADLAGAPPRRHLEEPLQHHDRGQQRRLLGPPAAQLLRRPHQRRRLARPPRHHPGRAQLARLRLRQALPAGQLPVRDLEPDRRAVRLHAGRARPAGLQARPHHGVRPLGASVTSFRKPEGRRSRIIRTRTEEHVYHNA